VNRKASKPVSKRKANIPARKPTKKQIGIMKEYWKQLMKDEKTFYALVYNIEKLMARETGIKDIEFIRDEWMGGEFVGIGNGSRSIKLIQRERLEG